MTGSARIGGQVRMPGSSPSWPANAYGNMQRKCKGVEPATVALQLKTP
ncbi:MAG: hypothetical protein KJP07_16980 [Desulfatitalea sp.]|nr:hypothetical protein [Desulfatitalea sp.]